MELKTFTHPPLSQKNSSVQIVLPQSYSSALFFQHLVMPLALYQLHFYTDAPEVLVEHGHDHEYLPFFLVTLSHLPAGAFLQQRTL